MFGRLSGQQNDPLDLPLIVKRIICLAINYNIVKRNST